MKDLKKMKKDELIKIIEEFRNKQESEKEDFQKLKNEKQELEEKQQFIFERFGASDYSELLILLMDLDSVGHTVKSLIEGNDELKKEVKEKEVKHYALTADGQDSLGMICGGQVTVVFERV